MEFENLFEEFAVILALAVATGMLAIRLRQPLIVAFIAVGIALGPSVFNLVEHNQAMELLAEFGIALLLFVVGLRLDLNLIRTMGPVALATGLGQITFTSVLVFVICKLLGMATVPALYVAAAMSFSSTIIIVKLLSDKREIDSLHGRIAIGFLIVQDIMVVITMIVITALGAAGESTSLPAEVGSVLAKGAALLIIVAVLIRYILPSLLFQAARSTELLVLFSIALAIGLAAFSHWIGFSKEVGAFLGGIALASTPYREAIGSRLTSVRDFLLLFFFIALGTQLDTALLGLQIPMALVLSAFVLIGNPLIVLTIMGLMGFRRRTSFLSGLAVAQISEFSLILAALGLSLGHIREDSVGLITLVALITITSSTYMILYSHQLFEFLSQPLKPFERKMPTQELNLETGTHLQDIDLILFGLGRYGTELANQFVKAGRRVLAIDFDPVVIRNWHNDDVQAVYGDAEDPDFLAALPVRSVQWVVSAIPEERVNRTLAQALRAEEYQGKLALTSHHKSVAKRLEESGTDLVLFPYRQAAAQTAYLISQHEQAQPD